MLDFIGLIFVILIYAFIIIVPLLLSIYVILTPIPGISWQARVCMGILMLLFILFAMWLVYGDNIKENLPL
jgi:hypothetical protein